MSALADVDPELLKVVRSRFKRLSEEGLLAFLECLCASMEVGWQDLATRHVARIGILNAAGLGDKEAATRHLEKMFKLSEGFFPDGVDQTVAANFKAGLKIANFKEAFMADISEAPTHSHALVDLAEDCGRLSRPPTPTPGGISLDQLAALRTPTLDADALAAAFSTKANPSSDYEVKKLRVPDLSEKASRAFIDNLYSPLRDPFHTRPVLDEYEPSVRHISLAAGILGINSKGDEPLKPAVPVRTLLQFEKIAGPGGRLVSGELAASSPIAQCYSLLQLTDSTEAVAVMTTMHESQIRAGVDTDATMMSGGKTYPAFYKTMVRQFSEPALTSRVAASRALALYDEFRYRVGLCVEQHLGDFDDCLWPRLADFARSLQLAHLPPPGVLDESKTTPTTASTAGSSSSHSGPKPVDGFPSKRAAKRAQRALVADPAAAPAPKKGKAPAVAAPAVAPYMYPPPGYNPYAMPPYNPYQPAPPAYPRPPAPPAAAAPGVPLPAVPGAPTPPPVKSTAPCFDYQKGTCTRGAACRFAH